jgi:hypothetical protein
MRPTRAPWAARDPTTRGGAWPPGAHDSRRSFRALVLDADGRGGAGPMRTHAAKCVGGARAFFLRKVEARGLGSGRWTLVHPGSVHLLY